MNAIEAGHVYEVADADGAGTQMVRFVRRRGVEGEPLQAAERRPGILSQELLRVLIDRTLYLYAEAPCDEDTAIIQKLRECLTLYEARAARRSIEKLTKPEQAEVCPTCHHLLCFHPCGGATARPPDTKPN